MRLEGIVPKRIDYDLRPGIFDTPLPECWCGLPSDRSVCDVDLQIGLIAGAGE